MRVAFAFAAFALTLAACAPEAGNAAAGAPAAAQVWPELTGRVVDQAALLGEAEEARLSRRLEALEARTSDQLVVVTVRSLGDRTIEAYGVGLGRHWGIGQADKDNGVLLLVAPAERQVRIEVGYGLEPILTDERAAEIIRRDILPAFREGEYGRGVEAGSAGITAMLIENEDVPRQRRAR